MTLTEIYENLCIRDKRNPYHRETFIEFTEEEIPPPREDCLCYNCLSGRDKLALEILRLRGVIRSGARLLYDEGFCN